MCLLCSSILPCSSSIDVDAMALCQAAGSLEELDLIVGQSCTSEALAKVFDHEPLEVLFLTLFGEFNAAEVSSTCSPGI